MGHERFERLIGERLDGQRVAGRDAHDLDRHLEACAECRAFERGAWRLRESVRFEVAPAVPDLVEPIMTSVEAESRRPRSRLRVIRAEERPPRARRVLPRLAPAIAAALVGVLAGSVVVGGPWADRDGDPPAPALAAEDITRSVAEAAGGIEAYVARFTIVERHLSPEMPERTLSMRVWFEAPERFRLDVTDRTTDPRLATPTNVSLIVDEDEWYVAGPAPCPSATCPTEETAVRNRAPFSSSAPAPTDLVLPLTALGSADEVEVLGRATILGREAVRVQLPFERASSLFPFLSLGVGEWRPLYASDRVRLWLDAESWFPLRWEVRPAPGERREAWARRFGLPPERTDEVVFSVEALHVDLARPPAGVFDVPDSASVRDQGAREIDLEALEDAAGFSPLVPAETHDLEPYRAVVPLRDAEGDAVLTYASGLSFLKIAETRSWAGDGPFGGVDVRAEEVALGPGVAYFEPASATHGRLLAIHAAGTDLALESNLPREALLEIAADLPVTGLPMPSDWTVRRTTGSIAERVTLDEARAAVPFGVEVPASLPSGTSLASVELVQTSGVVGVTLFFRGSEVATRDGEITIHLEPATALPPATATRQLAVDVAGVEGRWTPGRATLEWVSDGVYRSIEAPGLDLEAVLTLADGL